MKKTMVWLAACLLVVAWPLAVLAEEAGGPEKSEMDQGKGPMMHHKGMKEGCPMQGKMMHNLMTRSLVATSDGGVAVMSGTKLMKFDQNLQLVKEVEIPMDMEGMQKAMADMKAKCKCPMCLKHQEGAAPAEPPAKQ